MMFVVPWGLCWSAIHCSGSQILFVEREKNYPNGLRWGRHNHMNITPVPKLFLWNIFLIWDFLTLKMYSLICFKAWYLTYLDSEISPFLSLLIFTRKNNCSLAIKYQLSVFVLLNRSMNLKVEELL